MLRVLSQEESKTIESYETIEINEWFKDLSYIEKRTLYHNYKTIFKQIKCSHTSGKNSFYDKFTCSDCGYILPE